MQSLLTIVIVSDIENAVGWGDDTLVGKVVDQRLARNGGPYTL